MVIPLSVDCDGRRSGSPGRWAKGGLETGIAIEGYTSTRPLVRFPYDSKLEELDSQPSA